VSVVPNARKATTALTRPVRLDVDSFARVAGLHPDLVRRLVAAGALSASQDAAGVLWFSPGQLAALGRIQRLRAAFALNYAALGLVLDLLDRIEALEAALRSRQAQTGDQRWTPAA
jgi:chaperone modulatory protein CbpM